MLLFQVVQLLVLPLTTEEAAQICPVESDVSYTANHSLPQRVL
jgi:hypothetical protein